MILSKFIARSFVGRNFGREMSLEPPKVKVLEKFNREDFQKKISVPILTYDAQNVNLNKVLKPLRKLLLKIQKFQPVDNGKIYLNPELVKDYSQLPAEQLASEGIKEDAFKTEDFTLTYDNWNANDLIKAIMPDDIEPLTSYSRIGHIIHFNFRDAHLPYKSAIAQIYFDKSPGCRTIINKAENIDNTFRNFQIELLKGEADYQVEVKENGTIFQFDFSQVFWNPRLSAEHERLVKMVSENDVLYDVFAGVGPFSIPCAKKRVNVLSNDLNPHSFKWLEHNVKKNKVQDYVKTFNKDGRDFILENIRNDLIERIKSRENDPVEYSIHIAMNLPALSTTFLDAYVGLLKGHDTRSLPIPHCHCYCFVKGTSNVLNVPISNLNSIKGEEDPQIMAQKLVESHMGVKIVHGENLKEISFVRKVSNNKYMMRVDLLITHDILEGKISHKRENDTVDENPCKKACN